MRKFIHDLKLKDTQKIQTMLPQIALKLRKSFFPKLNDLILTMDSTPHKQYGEYMEGVEFNYKNIKCLDSQNCFDQFGLCYGWDLRSGSTYSSNGAVEMIERITANISKDFNLYFRADSAYSTLPIYNSLLTRNIKFTICLKENVWSSLLDKYEFKMQWDKTKVNFFDSNKCQIASCLYPVKGLQGQSFLRIVFIRTLKPKDQIKREKESGIKNIRHYKYYAIVTNISEYEMGHEKIINFYRSRANAENFIKDLKYGLDFLHFPCRSLRANCVWGLMGIFAYNLMRASSFLISSDGCFIKKVRNNMVKLACKIITHARKIEFRFSERNYKEVILLQEKIHRLFQVCSSRQSLLLMSAYLTSCV